MLSIQKIYKYKIKFVLFYPMTMCFELPSPLENSVTSILLTVPKLKKTCVRDRTRTYVNTFADNRTLKTNISFNLYIYIEIKHDT
jgi:lipopolysaccharide biosynthesis glycosyltransferase